MALRTWELDLRRRALLGWNRKSPVADVVQVRLVSDSKHRDAGTVQEVSLDLEHLKLLPKGRPCRPLAGRSTRAEAEAGEGGIVVQLTQPGNYRCVSEGSINEPVVTVVSIPALGSAKEGDCPVFYKTEEEAVTALALPSMWQADELRKDLAVYLTVVGAEGVNRARVALAETRARAVCLPPLSGTFKQILWVSVLREELVAKIDAAELSRGTEKRKMSSLLTPRRWIHPLNEELETLTFAELREELQHATDSESWLHCRYDLLQWLATRALERRKHPPGKHPF